MPGRTERRLATTACTSALYGARPRRHVGCTLLLHGCPSKAAGSWSGSSVIGLVARFVLRTCSRGRAEAQQQPADQLGQAACGAVARGPSCSAPIVPLAPIEGRKRAGTS